MASPLDSDRQQLSAAIEFTKLIGRLKTTPRTGWVRRGVPMVESVADHSWRVAALSVLLQTQDEDHETNPQPWNVSKLISMGVLHDIAECLIGDICPEDNVSKADKQQLEQKALDQLVSLLEKSGADSQYMVDCLHEYEKRQSREAKAVKDLDLLDMIVQADEYETRYGTTMDLSDFFQSTPPSKFQTPRLRSIATAVHNQRQERLQLSAANDASSLSDVDARPTKNNDDESFARAFSQESSMDVEDVRRVVKALRQFDKHSDR